MDKSKIASAALLRELCDTTNGVCQVSQYRLAAAIKTRKYQTAIGLPRAERLRGWLALEVDQGSAALIDQLGANQNWMGQLERKSARLRLDITWASDPSESANLIRSLEKLEAQAVILTWAAENEEPPREGNPYVLRKEKRAQLRTARCRVWKKLGEGSLNATILTLVEDGLAFPETDPGDQWIRQSVKWIRTRGWTSVPEDQLVASVTSKLTTMRAQSKPRDGNRSSDTILDMGEGWGSIGKASEEIQCASIGVDWADSLYQGTLHGRIRSRVHMNFASPGTANLLVRIARKAEIALANILMVWLSPECTLLSRANVMNKTRGCAHGPYAETPENIASATPQRLEEGRAKFRQCKIAVEQQMRALEEEGMLFALENPQGSHFWELESVTSRIARNPTWRLHKVDQCAFGRKAKKTTMILTNIPWAPRGLTGNGKCTIGICGDTAGNTPGAPGAAQHAQQTVASEPQRRTRMGHTAKGAKGEYSSEAAKNRVESLLVQELIQAARAHRASGAN
jgi:hypothetical protein